MSEKCMALLQPIFPDLDEEMTEYIKSVLAEHEHFDNADDVFEAIGPILTEVDTTKDEGDIQELCASMFSLMQKSDVNGIGSSVDGRRLLDAPVCLSDLGSAQSAITETSSIWITKRDDNISFDKRKLDKAEAKQKEKQERRLLKENNSSNSLKSLDDGYASVSQQSNRYDNVSCSDAEAGGRACDIRIENFDLSFGNKVLMENATLSLVFGRRYGLVGRNGLGKTTLLKALARRDLRLPAHLTLLHVEQEVEGNDTIAVDSVLECDTARAKLLAEEQRLHAAVTESGAAGNETAAARLSEVYAQLAAMEADKAPARAAVILHGLGFSPPMQRMPTREFSGGWRMRLALARALFARPDLLLLDEPTNMLDMKAIIWLEDYLQNWPTTLLVVSHDQAFLNSVATDIILLRARRLECYRGNFDNFEKSRGERLKNQQREYEAQQQVRQNAQEFIDKFRYNAKRASLVQSKIKMLEKLPKLEPVEKESDVMIRFPECEKLSPPILKLDEVDFSYDGQRVVLKGINANAAMDSRICLVGDNGAGKSTLLKLLLGDLEPARGIRHAHRSLRIGYFSQHHVDQLDLSVSSLEFMASKFPGQTSEVYRAKLGSFGVSGDLALKPIQSLSGGQKSRVAFAMMCASNPNFLILDEPTNHLDMETISAMGLAIERFGGGVVLVSHDERLIGSVCQELWLCSGGNVHRIEGGLKEYRQLVQKELAAAGAR